MTGRWILAIGFVVWAGATLVLSELRWFARRPLDDRLRPYVPGGWSGRGQSGLLSAGSFRDVLAPLATSVGDALGRVFGLHDDLATRLRRVHSPADATTIRVRQAGWAIGALLGAAAVSVAVGLPMPVALMAMAGAPLLAFLVIEQEVSSASTRWQHRLFLELPIICEQIGILLSAGYSLGSALDRIAARGSGCCATDLDRVCDRLRQGLGEREALREWAELADVDAVHRLVGILALNQDTGDLGRLISEEARSVRREVQRRRAAVIDRRAQQVWIPVTVATLLPGTIFLAVPFVKAMSMFSG